MLFWDLQASPAELRGDQRLTAIECEFAEDGMRVRHCG